ncbi:MAG: TetR family transcriptional regulator [Peptococcaceae bacterium]|nr:TetR family transcriptional regulator [Peptococcaceae bacterium]
MKPGRWTVGRKTGEKYGAIIEAAVKVFAENGYHNSQVSKIAREAGVADGTIYLYFKNKEDILISVFKVKMGHFIASVRQELEKHSDPFEKLRQLIRMHFSNLENDRNLAQFMQIQLRQSHPSIRAAIAEPLREYFRLIEALVAGGVAAGRFRPGLDVRLARQMIFGTIDEVATCWVMSRRQYSLADQVEGVLDLLSHGLSGRI